MPAPLHAAETAAQQGHNQFGKLPEWDLSDLYPGRDSPELKADLERAKTEAKAVEADYKGKLEGLARHGGLLEAVRRIEALSDLSGRLSAFAYLQYAQKTTDPDRAKFLGDLSQQLTDLSTGLIFFELELNRIDAALLEAAFGADQALAHY